MRKKKRNRFIFTALASFKKINLKKKKKFLYYYLKRFKYFKLKKKKSLTIEESFDTIFCAF